MYYNSNEFVWDRIDRKGYTLEIRHDSFFDTYRLALIKHWKDEKGCNHDEIISNVVYETQQSAKKNYLKLMFKYIYTTKKIEIELQGNKWEIERKNADDFICKYSLNNGDSGCGTVRKYDLKTTYYIENNILTSENYNLYLNELEKIF